SASAAPPSPRAAGSSAAARCARRRPMTTEVGLTRTEAAALAHAADTLRWLIAKTGDGWSHPAVDPAWCDRAAARFDALHYAAREQLKTAGRATVAMRSSDARLMHRFAATVEATDPGMFEIPVTQLRAIA